MGLSGAVGRGAGGVGRTATQRILERAKGIEPSYVAWEATVLPLNYARGAAQIVDRDIVLAHQARDFTNGGFLVSRFKFFGLQLERLNASLDRFQGDFSHGFSSLRGHNTPFLNAWVPTAQVNQALPLKAKK